MSFGDLKVQDLIYEDSSNNEITVVIADLATKANPTFTGTVTVPTATAGDNSTKAASTAFVVASFAPKSAPTFTGTINGVDLVLSGNLTVSGTQTIINTSVLDVEDINITLGKVSSPSDTTANNGGITLKGSTDKTFNWLNATDSWTSSEHIEIASGKNLKVDGTTFFVDGTNNRVGIGTTSPTGSLSIASGTYQSTTPLSTADDIVISGNQSLGISLITAAAGTSNNTIAFGDTDDTDIGMIRYAHADNSLQFTTNASERMRIDSSGRVGIGTSSMGSYNGSADDLVINNGASNVGITLDSETQCSIAFTDATTTNWDGWIKYIHSSNSLQFGASQGVALTLDSSQNATFAGTVTATSFSGSGANLTNLPAGGNTVDLVADGAIAAGKPCIIKSNGKVAQVQIASSAQDGVVRNANSEQTFGSTGSNKLEGNTRKNCVAYNPDSDTTFVISHVQSIDRMVGQLFSTPSTGTDAQKAAITRHQITEITSEGAGEDKGFFCVCNLSGKRFFIVYEKYNVMKCRVVTVAANNQSFSLGTENNLITSSSVKYKWFSAVETATDRVVLMCTSETNNGVFNDEHFGLICGDISNSGNSWTYRSNIELDNNNSGQGSKGGRIDYDSTNGVIGVSWSTDNNVTFRAAKVASGTGAAFTVGTGTQYASGTLRNTLKYHSNSGAWITFSCTNAGANYVQAHTVNSSTLAITSGTAVYLSSWAGGLRGVDIEVTNEHKIILAWLRTSDDITTKMYTISGTTITATSGAAVNVCVGAAGKETFGMVYQGHNSVASFYGNRDNNNGIFGGSGLTVTNATNLLDRNCIGWANSAISDSNTGTINLQGSVATGQSGLTPGQIYFVQDDGTLGNSVVSTQANLLAIASDKGLVQTRVAWT